MYELYEFIGNLDYVALGLIALWGGYCLVMAWRRVESVRFRDEVEQEEFLDDLGGRLQVGDFAAAQELCEDDRRALPQLALFAIESRHLAFPLLRRRLLERFEQDVLADLDHRLSWVATVIKAAPMLGLFGTVIGMMGAFSNLSEGTKADPGEMAKNIMLALITTAIGLAIAIPLVIASQGISVRVRKLENLISLGMDRLLEAIKPSSEVSVRRA
jgi:biopolymer transport protein ExbB/TolQ